MLAGWITPAWTYVGSTYSAWTYVAQAHGLWTSLQGGEVPSADVLAASITRDAGDVFDRITQGRGDFLLDNEAGGYSPGANAAVRPNQVVTFIADYTTGSGTTHWPLFHGAAYNYRSSPELGSRTLRVSAEDTSRRLVDQIQGEMFVNTIVGSMVFATLGAAGFEVAARRVDTITDRVLFGWADDERGGDAVDRLLKSGAHYWVVDGAGRALVKNRQWQETATTAGSYASFDDFTMISQEKLIRNRVGITAQPRKVTTDIRTVGSLDRAVTLDVGKTVTLQISYLDTQHADETDTPVVSLQALVGGVDYFIGTTITQSEGGTDLSSSSISSLSMTTLGRSALVTVTHIHSDQAFLQSLHIRGRPLQLITPIEQVAEDQASIDRFGRQELKIQNDIVSSRIHAQAYAEWVVDRYKDGIAESEFGLRNVYPDVLTLEPLSRIHAVNSFSGVASDFLIMGVTHSIQFSGRGHEHAVSYALRRANPGNYFVLDDATRGVLDNVSYVVGF